MKQGNFYTTFTLEYKYKPHGREFVYFIRSFVSVRRYLRTFMQRPTKTYLRGLGAAPNAFREQRRRRFE